MATWGCTYVTYVTYLFYIERVGIKEGVYRLYTLF